MNSSGPGRGDRTRRRLESTRGTEHAGGASYPSDGWLRTVLENTSDVICVLGADGTFLYVNPAIEKVLGYLPEDLMGAVSFDYVYPDDAAFVTESFAGILRTSGVHAPVEFRTQAADGSVRYVQAIPNNQLDNPVLRGVVVTFRDLTERVRVEEKVRFQARLLDAVGQSVIATDRQGKIVYWNLASEELYGWSAEEATGRTVLDIVLPEQTPEQREVIMSGLREGRSWSGEFELRRRDGTVFPAMVTTSSVLDDEDNVVGIIGVSTDISERKRAEEALQHSEEFVSQLLHNFPNGSVSVFDRDLYYVFAEGKALEQIGLLPETVIGRNLRELLPEEVMDSAERYYRKVLSGETVEFELPQGGGVYAINAAPLRSENGNIDAIISIAQNITDRKNAEEKLRASEERFRYLVQNSSDVITMVNIDGTVLYVSPAIERILGHHPTERVGRSAFELVHPDDTGRARDAFAQALQSPDVPASLELRMRHKDGSWRHVEVTGTNLLAEPSTNAIVVNSRDVTERRLVEAERREAEERYRTLIERIPAIVYIQEAGEPRRTTYVSPQNETILGYAPEEYLAEPDHWINIMHPDDRERILSEDGRTNESGEPFVAEYRQIAKDGRIVWIRDEATMVRDESGKPLYWLGVQTDITERKEAEERLQASEAELRALFAAIDDLVFEIDVQGRYLRVAPTNPSLLYPTEKDRIGKTLHDILPAKTAEKLLSYIRHSVESRETVKVEYSLVIEGKEKWFEGTVTPLSRESVVFVGRDITERRALEERLVHQALHDPLTKLPNRTLFTDRLRQTLARIRRRGLSLAVMFMDLDNFKVINDSLGHRMGDRLLVAATKRIRSVLRPEDTVARLGGDELVILLVDTDLDGAIHVAERILEKLRLPFSLGGRQLFVTASLGITVDDGNGKNASDLLRDADLAMYRAKHSGKSRYAVFEKAMNAQALERLELEHGLRRAVERNEFVVHYQPYVSLATGKIVGIEALARWEHPERGLLSPDEFVRVAEETGLIVPIGEVVLEEACRQAKAWQERRPSDSPAVCVNLSARQFWEPGLADTVGRILDETELDSHYLCLEVTESTAMSNAPATAATLEELQDLGVRAIIDDFGTGYSSLSYLERFPVDDVKIDRSFVGGLGEERGAAVLASGVISLAHALGLKVIAEGVETEEQLERLQEMGCDLAQGYLFSEPLTAQGVAALLVAAHHRNPLGSNRRGRHTSP